MADKENIVLNYGRYLAHLMACSINKTTPTPPDFTLDWEMLYRLATKHNVAVIITPCVLSLDAPQEIKAKFKYNSNIITAREARQEIEAQRVFAAFVKADIPFIKLKGIVLKNLFPQPYMRTHCDVDICVSEDDRERAKAVMAELGYNLECSIDYHDEYIKDTYFIFEIHSCVMSPRSHLFPLFDEPFKKSRVSEFPPGLQFENEYFYLSLFVHMYKHFVSEGCGIRLLCDLYVFEKAYPQMDFEMIKSSLAQYNLQEFFDNVYALCHNLFDGGEFDYKQEVIAEFILRSGEYGNPELKKLSWLSSDRSANLRTKDKIRYLMGNWFPSAKNFSRKYPVLKKAPILLPLCWIHRALYTVFKKRDALSQQQEEIKKLNSDALKVAKRIRHIAGIKE